MRISVRDPLHLEQAAQLIQLHRHGLVGIIHILTGQPFAAVFHHAAMLVDIAVRVDAIFLADEEVIRTESRRSVHAAGTSVGSDMIAQDDQRFPIVQRMLAGDHLQLCAFVRAQDLLALQAKLLPQLIHQLFQHDELSFFAVNQRISIILIQADRQVGRNGPRRRRPDNEARVRIQDALSVFDAERHEDGRALDVMIFDLRLSQRRFRGRRPVDRLEPLVNETVHRHLAEDADLTCLKFLFQRDVGIIIITDASQGQESVLLVFHLLHRIIVTKRAELRQRHLLAVIAQLRDGRLDRQAMRIPSGDIRRIIPVQIM